MNIKAHQKNRLILEFGVLIQPFEDLLNYNEPPTIHHYRIAIAKVQGGDPKWRLTVRDFVKFAEDVIFHKENQDISHVPERFCNLVNEFINNSELIDDLNELRTRFRNNFKEAKCSLFEFVDRIPIQWEPEIFEANTPFTAYLRINECVVTARRRLHYFDRYLKAAFFQLFLENLGREVEIRLVTTLGTKRHGVTGVKEISDLARQEFNNYQLIQVSPDIMHDRNLRIDDNIFTLGPGVDRAGVALTNFGPSDSSQAAHHQFDSIITNGTVIHWS